MRLNEEVRMLAEYANSLGLVTEAAVIGEAATFCKSGKPGEGAKLLVDVVAALLVESEARAVKA